MTQTDIEGVAKNASSTSLSHNSGDTSSVLANSSSVDMAAGDLNSSRFAQYSYFPLHERIKNRMKSGIPFFSLEFLPPQTVDDVADLYTRIDQCKEGDPLFVDITWQYARDPANLTCETSSSSMAAGCLNYSGMETMLHMTCSQYSK